MYRLVSACRVCKLLEVGVHAVGEVTEHSFTGRLLSRLTDGRLEWASLGDVYDEFYWPGDFRIDFPDTPDFWGTRIYTPPPRGTYRKNRVRVVYIDIYMCFYTFLKVYTS